MEKYLYDIPIYRCSGEKHNQELYEAKEKRLQYLIDLHGPEIKNSNAYECMKNNFDRRLWYPWRYNEVIGWIRIYALDDQVRGELWFTNAKRIRRDLKNKKFFDIGKAFEMTIFKSQSSTDIFNAICEELASQEKKVPLKGRYLDKDMFCRIGKFINWRQIFGMEA